LSYRSGDREAEEDEGGRGSVRGRGSVMFFVM